MPNNENNQAVTGITYTQTNWVDGVTPVDAEHLNNIEGGVTALVNAVSILQESVDNAVTGEMNDKQNKVDDSLQTPDNSVVGAINYLYNNKQNKIGDSISLSGNGNSVSIEISNDRLKIEDGYGSDVELFGLSAPSYNTSAVNKTYVDSAISGVNYEIESVIQSKQDKDADSISLSGNGGHVTASYESQNRISMSGDSDSAVSIGGIDVSSNPEDTDAANVGYANSVPESVQYTFSSGSKTIVGAINDLYASKQDNVSDNISLSDGTNGVTLTCGGENTLSVSGTSGADIKISGVTVPNNPSQTDVANVGYVDSGLSSKQDKQAEKLGLTDGTNSVDIEISGENSLSLSGASGATVKLSGIDSTGNDGTAAANKDFVSSAVSDANRYADSVPTTNTYTFSSGDKTVVGAIDDILANKQDKNSSHIDLTDGYNTVTVGVSGNNALSLSGENSSDVSITGLATISDDTSAVNKVYVDTAISSANAYADNVPTEVSYEFNSGTNTVVGEINKIESAFSNVSDAIYRSYKSFVDSFSLKSRDFTPPSGTFKTGAMFTDIYRAVDAINGDYVYEDFVNAPGYTDSVDAPVEILEYRSNENVRILRLKSDVVVGEDTPSSFDDGNSNVDYSICFTKSAILYLGNNTLTFRNGAHINERMVHDASADTVSPYRNISLVIYGISGSRIVVEPVLRDQIGDYNTSRAYRLTNPYENCRRISVFDGDIRYLCVIGVDNILNYGSIIDGGQKPNFYSGSCMYNVTPDYRNFLDMDMESASPVFNSDNVQVGYLFNPNPHINKREVDLCGVKYSQNTYIYEQYDQRDVLYNNIPENIGTVQDVSGWSWLTIADRSYTTKTTSELDADGLTGYSKVRVGTSYKYYEYNDGVVSETTLSSIKERTLRSCETSFLKFLGQSVDIPIGYTDGIPTAMLSTSGLYFEDGSSVRSRYLFEEVPLDYSILVENSNFDIKQFGFKAIVFDVVGCCASFINTRLYVRSIENFNKWGTVEASTCVSGRAPSSCTGISSSRETARDAVRILISGCDIDVSGNPYVGRFDSVDGSSASAGTQYSVCQFSAVGVDAYATTIIENTNIVSSWDGVSVRGVCYIKKSSISSTQHGGLYVSWMGSSTYPGVCYATDSHFYQIEPDSFSNNTWQRESSGWGGSYVSYGGILYADNCIFNSFSGGSSLCLSNTYGNGGKAYLSNCSVAGYIRADDEKLNPDGSTKYVAAEVYLGDGMSNNVSLYTHSSQSRFSYTLKNYRVEPPEIDTIGYRVRSEVSDVLDIGGY